MAGKRKQRPVASQSMGASSPAAGGPPALPPEGRDASAAALPPRAAAVATAPPRRGTARMDGEARQRAGSDDGAAAEAAGDAAADAAAGRSDVRGDGRAMAAGRDGRPAGRASAADAVRPARGSERAGRGGISGCGEGEEKQQNWRALTAVSALPRAACRPRAWLPMLALVIGRNVGCLNAGWRDAGGPKLAKTWAVGSRRPSFVNSRPRRGRLATAAGPTA